MKAWKRSALLGTLIAASGCTGEPPDDGTCTVELGSWSAPDFETNAAEALALRGRLDALTAQTMRDAETGDASVTLADLQALYEAGSPSAEDVTTTAWQPIVDDALADFVDLADVGTTDLLDDQGQWDPGEHGGIWESSFRGIDEGGIETRQILDKGLFGGGALYPQALDLTAGEITPETIESILAYWGGDATLNPEERTDSANYSYRMGYYASIADAFAAAHAYAGDPACEVERDAALVDGFRLWEESLFARFVYYANAAAPLLAAPSSDADVAQALHALAEGLGLGLGFLGVPSPEAGPLAGAGRVIVDADVEASVELFGLEIGDLGASTTHTYVTDPTGYQDAVDDLELLVGEVFDLTDAEVAAFRDPTGG